MIAKDQLPTVAKNLNATLDKFDRNPVAVSALSSKGVSPNKVI